MKISINTLPIDLAGEILMSICFKEDRYNIRSNFYSISLESNSIPDKVWCYFDNNLSLDCYENGNLIVVFQDDGDRTTVIIDRADYIAYVNTDAKKAYGWKTIKIEPRT